MNIFDFLYGFSNFKIIKAWLNINGATSKMTNWPARIWHAAYIHVCRLQPKIVGLEGSTHKFVESYVLDVPEGFGGKPSKLQKEVHQLSITIKRCSADDDTTLKRRDTISFIHYIVLLHQSQSRCLQFLCTI
jgi:hypothetical protein